MRYILSILVLILCLSGSSMDNKAESIPAKVDKTSIDSLKIETDSIDIEQVEHKTHELDSLLQELKKYKNEKN